MKCMDELIEEQGLIVVDAPKYLDGYVRSRGWFASTAAHMQLRVVKRAGTSFKGILHPFLSVDGEPVGFQAKWLGEGKLRWSGGGKLPLYNLPGLRCVDADQVLFICEGLTDTISALDTWGLDWPVIGVPGASWVGERSLSDQAIQFETALRQNEPEITVIPDNDAAGEKFVYRIKDLRGDQIAVLRVPDRFNDFSEWRTQSPDFRGELQTAIQEMSDL